MRNILRKPGTYAGKGINAVTNSFCIISLCFFVLSGCAITPEFDLKGVDKVVTPKHAAEQMKSLQGQKVLWGGLIVNSSNTSQGTQFEILAYPLDNHYKPQTDQVTLGRFIANSSQYLETLDYAQGRLLSVIGTLKETKAGKIGDAEYIYPVVTIEQHHLWKTQSEQSMEPTVHFGVGVIFH